LDLVQLLIETSESNYLEVRALFEFPVTKLTETLIQTLSEIRPTQGQALLDELFSQIFPIYLQNHSNYIRLLESLWEANQDLVISSICELYKSENKK
jgi:CCR4-NOT transcription complex subunit 1